MSDPLAPDEWPRLEALVDALLDAPPERRSALLTELSQGDAARRAALEQLLADCERAHPLLDRPAAARFAELLGAGAVPLPASLAERYRVTRELGRGGMAVVYLARDLKHGRDVALKVVRPELVASLGRERFLREIAIIARLRHPQIVPLYDSGDVEGFLYYVMPYEEGHSLRARLTRDGPLPVDDAVLILRDVCDALAHAHAHGIVHRDIKPDNVLLAGRRAMVADFGVARAVSAATDGGFAALTTAGVALGTPAYMAPEQVAADPEIDHRADIYAVGVLAYEILTGRTPFGSGTPQEVLSAHLTRAPEPVTQHRPEVPAALSELVMKCLEKRPVDRWQSAEDLRTRLESAGVRTGDGPALARRTRVTRRLLRPGAVVAAVLVGVVLWQLTRRQDGAWQRAWENARVERLTDFAGSEVDATISNDGKLVAFLADREGPFDAFVTQVGTGAFRNLTMGGAPQALNEDVRNVGFSHDAAHVWIRVGEIDSPAHVSMTPTMGGPLKPFIDVAVTVAWSPDGSKLAYHQATDGDPIYLADTSGGNARRIFGERAGIHCHHLAWSRDGRFIYFSRGFPPNVMDIWRVPVAGGPAERITRHNSRVGYPVLLDERTLVYTATADDGTGPWLYSMDLRDRVPRRVSRGVEQYISIAASDDVPAQARRLVATVSNPSVSLWEVPVTDSVTHEEAATRIALPTARAAAPRFGPDSSLYYLASRSGTDGLWRRKDGSATEVWKAGDGAVVDAPAVSPDGRTVCFPVRRGGRSTLHCATASGTGTRTLADSLDVLGPGSWSPDGKWIAIGAIEAGGVYVFKIPVDGGPPVRLVDSVSSNPAWSPDGSVIVYAGTPRGRRVTLKAVTPAGQPHPLPPLSLDRLGDSYRFLPDGKQLVVKKGGFRHQDFWLFDLATGNQQQLTSLRPGESVHRFDLSPDGKRIVFERVRENSDIALIELPRP